MPEKTNTIFISHAGADAEQALELQEALAAVGITSRLDQIDLRLGDNVIKWMNDAAGESDYLLVLVSKNSVGRYWVETEWSAALAREADLRRTFVVPVIMSGVEDKDIPFLLRAKLYLDMRQDPETALLRLINFLKQDQQVARDHGRLPAPAPMSAQEEVDSDFPESCDWINIIVFSNRFARTFRFALPAEATPSYILALLRSKLNLKWSSIDSDLMVELAYTYAIGFKGKHLPLDTPIRKLGVRDGSVLQLWIRVTLTDLLEKKKKVQNASQWLEGAGKTSLARACYFVACRTTMADSNIAFDIKEAAVKKESDRIMELLMSNRDFTSAQIAMIAQKYFSHVDM